WQDHRADDEARELEDELGDPQPLFGTRLPLDRGLRPGEAPLAFETRTGDGRAHASRSPAQGLRGAAADGLPPLRSLVQQGPLPRVDRRAGDRPARTSRVRPRGRTATRP